jgi:glycosyltransferase involved in cell wall biosynthesis
MSRLLFCLRSVRMRTPLSNYEPAMLFRLFFLSPFALIRLLVALGFARNPSGLFFFLPYYHVGGAEKIHLDIVRCCRDRRPWVFFTRLSYDTCFHAAFADCACLCEFPIDLFRWLRPFYSLLVALVAHTVNRHPQAVVFGCNCPFYYAVAPRLKEHVRAIDLIHAFGGGIEHTSLSVAPRLDCRVTISARTKQDLRDLYASAGFDPALSDRIVIIPNGVDLPREPTHKPDPPPLQVLHVGRGVPEKRVHLIAEIAARCQRDKLPVSFTVVGDMGARLEQDLRPFCHLTGRLHRRAEVEDHYRRAHAVLLVSSREGVPLVILEGMACGAIPLATNVGAIPENVDHGTNGLLFDATEDGDIVRQALEAIGLLCREPEVRQRLAAGAFEQARRRFSHAAFSEAYRKLLLGDTATALSVR